MDSIGTVCKHWALVFTNQTTDSKHFPWYSGLTISDLRKLQAESRGVESTTTMSTPMSLLESETIHGDTAGVSVANDQIDHIPVTPHSMTNPEASSNDSDVELILSRSSRHFQNRKSSDDVKQAMISNLVATEVTNKIDDISSLPSVKTGGKHKSAKDVRREEKLRHSLKEIQNEQQQMVLVDYVTNCQSKIASMSDEKRRLKRLIRTWNTSYEKLHGHLPTSADRTGHLRELHEEYQQVRDP
jgi:hypothetical protein